MHYANGRPAKNGDKIVQVFFITTMIGVLYDAIPGNDYCNGQLAPMGGGPHVGACLADCLHLDDVLAALHIDRSKELRAQLALVPRSG